MTVFGLPPSSSANASPSWSSYSWLCWMTGDQLEEEKPSLSERQVRATALSSWPLGGGNFQRGSSSWQLPGRVLPCLAPQLEGALSLHWKEPCRFTGRSPGGAALASSALPFSPICPTKFSASPFPVARRPPVPAPSRHRGRIMDHGSRILVHGDQSWTRDQSIPQEAACALKS